LSQATLASAAEHRCTIKAEDPEAILSAASVWEIAIKAGLGRITLPVSFEEYILEKVEGGFRVLSIDWTHAAAVERLPSDHRDPFDRLLIAQAVAEDLPVIANDVAFRSDDVAVIW
jgi:PIN domain nuclease of toxin-antitoxin system